MSAALYAYAIDEWRKVRPHLSPESQACPPPSVVQRYGACLGERGAFMRYHTDMRTEGGQQIAANVGDVIGASAGVSTNFWYGARSGLGSGLGSGLA